MTGVGTGRGDLSLDALPADTRRPDAAADAPLDVAVDHPPDVGVDHPPDVAVDHPPDVTPDVAPDLPVDTRPLTDLANGAACGAGPQCKSGFCVDGVCCDKACNNGCMACSKARTGLAASGTCGAAKDRDGKECGRACGVLEGRTAVVQKVCTAGACGFPTVPVAIERCISDGCANVFCDDATARCVSNPTCAPGACCCSGATAPRACVKREMCTGERACAP
jgi:hypothetical protein